MSQLLTRSYGRLKVVGLRFHFGERGSKVLTVRWSDVGMYRYHHNKRLRAAFLLDRRLDRWRG